MVVLGVLGSSYPTMKEWLIDAFRFEIVDCDDYKGSTLLYNLSRMVDSGSTMIFIDNIRTLKQYRSLRFYFGCVIIRIGVSKNAKIKPDYIIENPGNGIEIRNIIYDLM